MAGLGIWPGLELEEPTIEWDKSGMDEKAWFSTYLLKPDLSLNFVNPGGPKKTISSMKIIFSNFLKYKKYLLIKK